MVTTIAERLKAKTPRLIKKVQKLCTAIGGLAGTGLLTIQIPNFEIPFWVGATVFGATALNHLILELTTEEDFTK